MIKATRSWLKRRDSFLPQSKLVVNVLYLLIIYSRGIISLLLGSVFFIMGGSYGSDHILVLVGVSPTLKVFALIQVFYCLVMF